ncbi:hypothetical protein SLEP1_g58902 [Rubroshorea leprosula]|uniref:Uncharacterized protein n=1 Tax=Rubroshorea leprosula TaxID=152421 RepID=A0AAV5MQR6_9ROSI|nr:hypothetical protein SLEP1_g58902 [Rubroshorea leprosula]
MTNTQYSNAFYGGSLAGAELLALCIQTSEEPELHQAKEVYSDHHQISKQLLEERTKTALIQCKIILVYNCALSRWGVPISCYLYGNLPISRRVTRVE